VRSGHEGHARVEPTRLTPQACSAHLLQYKTLKAGKLSIICHLIDILKAGKLSGIGQLNPLTVSFNIGALSFYYKDGVKPSSINVNTTLQYKTSNGYIGGLHQKQSQV
jgi:hypothetical protein